MLYWVGFFLCYRLVGRARKGEEHMYFQNERYASSIWMDSYCPAALLKETSCHAQEGRNKEINLVLPGTISLMTSLSSRGAGVRVNASNKQCWYSARAWTTPPPKMKVKQLVPSLLGYAMAVAFVSCKWPRFCANTVFKPKGSVRK